MWLLESKQSVAPDYVGAIDEGDKTVVQTSASWAERTRVWHMAIVPPVLALTAFLLAFARPIPLGTQITILAVGVAVLGLPHGALDLHMLRREMAKQPSFWWSVVVASAYIMAALVVLSLWQIHSPTALLAFLVASAFHFGHIDTPKSWGQQHGGEHVWRELGHGMIPIAVPSFFRAQETTALYNWLLGSQQALNVLEVRLLAGAGLALVAYALWVEIFQLLRMNKGRKKAVSSVITAVCSAALFICAPPLIAFTLYFCLWHSISHSIDLAARLDGRSPWRAIKRFAGAAALPTAATWIMLSMIGLWLAAETAPTKATVQTIFIGLSCLSAPHLLLSAWIAHARTAREHPAVENRTGHNEVLISE
jgi:Brp/Blh family beta-carotene 15,15'-monooxygenase